MLRSSEIILCHFAELHLFRIFLYIINIHSYYCYNNYLQNVQCLIKLERGGCGSGIQDVIIQYLTDTPQPFYSTFAWIQSKHCDSNKQMCCILSEMYRLYKKMTINGLFSI